MLRKSPTATGEEQRRQVELALRPRAMGPLLEQAFRTRLSQGAPPECSILDVKYEPGAYCTVLYRLGERMVIGSITWGEADEDMPATQYVVEPLGMRVCLFEHDPALPGLKVARDARAMARALNEALPECRRGEARVLRCSVSVLRYRPGRRCTLRVDAWLRDAQTGAMAPRTLFGKLYHTLAKATPAYQELRLLADSAPARDGRVTVARPAAFLPDLLLVLQEPVDGTPLDLLIGRPVGATTGDPRGWDAIVRAASALAAVHTAGLTAGRERAIAAELRRFGTRAAQIAAVAPEPGARLVELAAALWAGFERLPAWGAEVGLVHGDCKPNQFLIGSTGVAILDFDHCGMADPANDVGTFMATLRQLGIRQSLKARGSASAVARSRWLVAMGHGFLEAYCAASERGPGFRPRATWYEAVALMRKALRAFGRSPRSPLPAALADEARHCLAALPLNARLTDEQLDPLRGPVIQKELPGLQTAFDAQQMREYLQTALFGKSGTHFVIERCMPGKAIYMGDCCALRYRLEVGDRAGGRTLHPVVGGRVFRDPLDCATYMHDKLAPLAALMRGREETAPFVTPVAILEPLHLVVHVFPIDGELPTLVGATDRRRMVAIFNETLPDALMGRFIAEDCQIVPVNYARRYRCVMRYEIVGQSPGCDGPQRRVVYGKVATDSQGAVVGAVIDALRERLAASRGEHRFTIPRSLGFRPDLKLTLLEAIEGAPRISELLKARLGGADVAQGGALTLEDALDLCGRTASALHTSGIALGPPRALDDELAGLTRDTQALRRVAPELGAQLEPWLERIGTRAEESVPLPRCFSHGDYTHAQLIFDDRSSGLVDFDTVCQAEPALDLGQFLAYLRVAAHKAAGGGPPPIGEQLGARFLNAYIAATGDQLESEQRLRARVAVYEIVSLLRMALRGWQQLKSARFANAIAVLEEGPSCLTR